jgi:hypothetical protein
VGAFTANITGLKWSFHGTVRLVFRFVSAAAKTVPYLLEGGAEYCVKARHVKQSGHLAPKEKNLFTGVDNFFVRG